MVGVLIGKVAVDSTVHGGAPSCIVYRTAKSTNEEYHEYVSTAGEGGDNMEEEGEIGTYNPELDSPSSWTTKSSTAQQRGIACTRLLCCMKTKSQKLALYTHVVSNVILVLFTITGIVYGILGITTDVVSLSDDDSSTTAGGAIIFGSVVGGVVSLILVNVSWWYRSDSCWCSFGVCSCPTAQAASSAIVLLAGTFLVPTYYDGEDQKVVYLIIFSIILPLLGMVSLPMLFDSNEGGHGDGVCDCKGEEGEEEKERKLEKRKADTMKVLQTVKEDRKY